MISLIEQNLAPIFYNIRFSSLIQYFFRHIAEFDAGISGLFLPTLFCLIFLYQAIIIVPAF